MTRHAGADLLAWPGALGARLAVLGLLLVCASLLSGAKLASLGYPDDVLEQSARCMDRVAQLAVGGKVAEAELKAAFARCGKDLKGMFLVAPLVLLAGVGILAVAIYAAFPVFIRRLERVDPETCAPPAALFAWVTETIAESGLAGRVRVHWRMLDPRLRASVFGCFGRYEVILAGGIIGQALAEPDAARESLRHELAHIRQGDVDALYVTRALWYAFLIGAVLPTSLAIPFLPRVDQPRDEIGFLFEIGAELLILAALVLVLLAARNLVLHEIEHRADLASGAPDWATPEQAPSWMPGWVGRHAPGRLRRRVLAHPVELLRVRAAEVVLLGAVLGLALPVLVAIAAGLALFALAADEPRTSIFPLAFAITGPFSVFGALVGIVLWHFVLRDRIGAILSGTEWPRMRRGALLFCLGIVAGLAAAPVFGAASFIEQSERLRTLLAATDPVSAVAALGALAVTFLFMWAVASLCIGWLAMVAECWAAVLLIRRTPRPMLGLGAAMAGVALGPVFASLLYALFLAASIAIVGVSPAPEIGLVAPVAGGVMVFICNPLNVLGVALFGLLPLVAGLRLGIGGRDALPSESGLLAPGQTVHLPDPRPSLAALGVALIALGAGFFAMFLTPVAAKLAAKLTAKLTVGIVSENQEVAAAFLLIGVAWISFVTCVACAAAALVRRMPQAHVFAVCGMGGIGLGAFTVVVLAPDEPLVPVLVANGGGWLSVIVASMALGLMRLVRGRHAAPTLSIRRSGPTSTEAAGADRTIPAGCA